MPRSKSPGLTDAELRLMQVLWEKGAATVGDVAEALGANYSTVLTILRILEKKGYLAHKTEGRAFVYRPLVPIEKAQERAVSHLVRGFFQGSPELLMLNLLDKSGIRPEELAKLRKRIEEAK
jgi:predicted transcriptional regulator